MKKSLRRILGLGVGLALNPHINAANHGVNVVLINLDDAGNGDFSHKGHHRLSHTQYRPSDDA